MSRSLWRIWAAVAVFVLPAFSASHFVVIGGLGGEPDYEQRFAGYVRDLKQVLAATAGDESRVYALSGPAATRKAVEESLEKIARNSSAEDSIAVILIGHGTYDGYDYKFNLPGPDIDAVRLRQLLDAVPAKNQLVVNTTSASGAMLELFKTETRSVVAATKNGRERNATVFARYLVEALRDPTADTDKNEVITGLEAFVYAEAKVKNFYDTEKRLATEHARLEGDSAGRITLARLGTAAEAANDPAKAGLLTKREEIERKIDALKLRKPSMPEAEYFNELTKMLVSLAEVQSEIEGK